MGGPIERATAVLAAWTRYAEGVDEQGDPIQVVGRLAPELRERAVAGGTAFLDNAAVFGDLAADPRFRGRYLATLACLHEHGVRRTLEDIVATGPPPVPAGAAGADAGRD